ncbi:MAG: inositol monophosphatase family protein [Planctomycetaceae bacterium]
MPDPFETAKDAARLAGAELMRYFAQEWLEVRDKSAVGGATFDLVSDADLAAEQIIASRIRQSFPDHALLGEESLGHGADFRDAEHLWVIDPLDGTNNFAHRLPHFAVSIAYYHRGTAVVGVIYNPATDQWFTASRGEGAFFGDLRVSVCADESLSKVLVGCGFYYDRGEMMRKTLATIEELFSLNIHGIRRMGAASLDLCMVGCGQFGGYFEYRLSPWDFAAGRLFVEQAGGVVTDAQGRPLPLASSSVLASNGRLHEAMLAVTAKHHP